MEFSDQELERYSRQIILREVGGVGQVKLKQSHIVMIGAGGLGCPVALYLAGAGVGHITIIDGDIVDMSNLQRQVAFISDDIGTPKAEALAARMLALNPDIKVTPINSRADSSNIEQLITQADLIIDGCDNFTTRLLVSDACVKLQKTLISGAIAGYEGQIATFKPHTSDTLPCYRCFMPQHPGEVAQRTCSDMGVLGPTTGMMASLMSFEALRELVGIKGGLAGKIRLTDLLGGTDRTINLPKDPNCACCALPLEK